LVVDDDVMVRRVSARMLEETEVLLAATGSEACEVLEQRGAESIDCVLLDMKMPGLSFQESFEGIRRIRPDLPVVACSLIKRLRRSLRGWKRVILDRQK